ncbi:MAG: hypothetical protein A2Y73_01045 [Chloroflexi bacterium RBG_13_56_8]|nr:MAG: hypothetical protein A2Y73_01045 [Chloroflexi bacterium RBG_13_56_8]
MVTRFQVSAGGIVCRRDEEGQVSVALIATHEGERWALPKGWVEKGEALEETALREVREETGLQAEIVERLDPIEYWFWGDDQEGQWVRFRKKVYFFRMDYVSGDLSPHDAEADEARWFPLDEAIEHIAYDNEREVLQAVKVAVEGA